jgi:hypothetical protein
MGGVLACILLGIYAFLIWQAIDVVDQGCNLACQQGKFNEKMAAALLSVGALVSGVIIAELAITRPNQTPGARLLNSSPSASAVLALKIIVYAYLAVWLICGLAAFIVNLKNLEVHKPLQDAANAWFGLAIAAGYAFFGINPHDTDSQRVVGGGQ